MDMTLSPVSNPSITVGKRTYSLKFTMLAQFKLSESRISLADMAAKFATNDVELTSLSIKLLAAMAAHNFIEAGEPIPTAEWWASVIPQEQYPAIVAAMMQAFPKPQPSPEAPAVTAPSLAN